MPSKNTSQSRLLSALARSTRNMVAAAKRRPSQQPSSVDTDEKKKRRKPSVTVPRRRVVEPTLREFDAYMRILNDSDGGVPVRFPGKADERPILHHLRLNDATMFEGVFDERFVTTINSMFGVNSRVSFPMIARQFAAQCAGAPGSRRWRDAYSNDSRLGLFERKIPFLVRVTLTRETNADDESSFKSFVKSTFAHPVTLHVGPTLLGKMRLLSGDESDSLDRIKLRNLGARSVYYRRIFMTHLLLWMTACEGLRRLDDSDVGEGNSGVVLVIQRSLRSIMKLPTTMSILLHNDPRVSLHYL